MSEFAVLLMLVGAIFTLASALGVARFPCTFTRAHALGVAASLGVLCVMGGVVFVHQTLGAGAKAILTIVFIFLTAPVGTHMLARAVYLFGDHGTDLERDDLSGHIEEVGDPTEETDPSPSAAS